MDAKTFFHAVRQSERIDVEEDEETTHYFYANLMFQLQSIDTKKHKARCKMREKEKEKKIKACINVIQ